MSIEIIAGLPGAGKTYLMKKTIEEEIHNKNIYVFQNSDEYTELVERYGGNLVKTGSYVETNMFEFNPGGSHSGSEYEKFYKAQVDEIFTFLSILLSLYKMSAERKIVLHSVITELYESVGITNIEYKPNVEEVSKYITIDTYIELMSEKDQEIANELKKRKYLFNKENNIAAFFQPEEKMGDLSFAHSFNAIDISGNTSVFNVRDAVLYSYFIAVKKKARLSNKPILFVIDESQWIWLIEEWWFADVLLSNFDVANQDVEIKIVSQSIYELEKRIPELISEADLFTLFKQSVRDLEFSQEYFCLSDKERAICVFLNPHQTFTIKKGYELKSKIRRAISTGNLKTKKMGLNIKIQLLKLKYPKTGYYERMCLMGGYNTEQIDDMVANAIKDGFDIKDDYEGREEVCKMEVSYWE